MKSFEKLVDPLLLSVSKQDQTLRTVLATIVPPDAMAKIAFFRIEGGRLRVTVSSAAWIARLRFCERQIVTTLRTLKHDVHTVSWHVAGRAPTTRQTKRYANTASDECEANVLSVINSLTHDSEEEDHLAQQLLRLSQNIAKNKR